MNTVLGTQMHWLTLVLILIEFPLFVTQLFHFLNRPQDRQRLWYLLLLGILIKFNLANGLLPDPSWHLNLKLQNMVADGFAYLMGAYIPFYFYKAYRLKVLRFHATWGVTIFLLIPYLIFDVVYAYNGRLLLDQEWAVIIPGTYGLIVVIAMLRAIIGKYRESGKKRDYQCELIVWAAILPWELMTIFAFYDEPQWLRIGMANLGWLAITLIQFAKAIRRSRREYLQYRALTVKISKEEFVAICKGMLLSSREIDVALLIREDFSNLAIAERLFISELTVKTHVTSILKKAGCRNRKELLFKILTTKTD